MGIKSHQIMEFTLHDRFLRLRIDDFKSLVFLLHSPLFSLVKSLGRCALSWFAKKLGGFPPVWALGLIHLQAFQDLCLEDLRRLATWKSKTNRTKEPQFPLGKSCPKLSCSPWGAGWEDVSLIFVKLIAPGHTPKDCVSKLASPKHPWIQSIVNRSLFGPETNSWPPLFLDIHIHLPFRLGPFLGDQVTGASESGAMGYFIHWH